MTSPPRRVSRPLSPDFSFKRSPRLSVSLQSKDKNELLSSSLPAALTRKELEHVKEMERSSKSAKWQKTYEELQESRGTLSSLRSSLGAFRPRSVSLYTMGANGSSKRAFLGLSRLRSTSPLQQRASSKQSNNQVRTTKDKEPNTHKIDVAFAQIRHQLDQLSEEDYVMEKRVNHLMSEITKLIHRQQTSRSIHTSPVPLKPTTGYKRTLSDDPCMRTSSGKHNSCHGHIVLSDLQETWEERSMEKSYEEEVDHVPFDLACKEFEETQESPEIRSNGLESIGSAVSATESPTSGCILVVTDASGRKHTITSRTSEDDVFLSQ